MGQERPTLRGAEDLRGILNSGHSRGWPYVRWDPKTRQREDCQTFAMAIIGGIGDMPDTIEDRSVIIRLRRRAADEPVSQWRSRHAVPQLGELRERLHKWVRGHLDALADADPDLPVEDRAADCWAPLVAIAEAAGGDWPERARRACKALTAGIDDPDDGTAGERLLADLRDIFGDAHCLYTVTMLDRLHEIEEAPWTAWDKDGKPLSSRGFARLLRPYGVRTKDVREGGTGVQRKGLYREQLIDAWSRYAPTGDVRDNATSGREAPENIGPEPVAEQQKTSATPSATRSEPDVSWRSDDPVADVADERLEHITA